jgi:hypothetical protein
VFKKGKLLQIVRNTLVVSGADPWGGVMGVVNPPPKKAKKGQQCQVQFQPAQCDFTRRVVIFTLSTVITTRLDVINTRKAKFLHAECYFNTHEFDFNTHKIDFYPQSNISTRRV